MLRSLRGKKAKAQRPPKPSKDEAKRLHARFHHQLWEAQNSPAPTADFSACGLDTLSPEALAACHNKHTLLLHSNLLMLLPPACARLSATLRVLDLHDNYLTVLDPAVGTLKQLQVLNLQHNLLEALPEEVGLLPNLQSLNLQENGLQALPASICRLSRLRTLNLQDNNLQRLPPGFWQLRALETFVVAGNPNLSGVNPDVLAQGTSAIMKLLCHEAGQEYIPPSAVAAETLGTAVSESADSKLTRIRAEEDAHVERMLARQLQTEKERQAVQDAARQALAEEQQQRVQLLHARQEDRAQTARLLHEHEATAAQQRLELQTLLQEQRAAILTQLAAEAAEEDRRARAVVARWEEARNDPNHVARLLAEQDRMDQTFLAASLARSASRQAALDQARDADAAQSRLAAGTSLAKEEARRLALAQLQAYQNHLDGALSGYLSALQRSRAEVEENVRQQELRELRLAMGVSEGISQRDQERLDEIRAVEAKMSELMATATDLNASRLAHGQMVVADMQAELARRLATLREEEAQREAQRCRALVEITEADQRNLRAYWEARLSESMRQLGRMGGGGSGAGGDLEGSTAGCDPVVQSVLVSCGCTELAPVFALHNVDAVVLRILTDQDLKHMGIKSVGTRKRLLLAAADLFTTA